ncbi:TadE/TadG family type IV pilus assembly protein [Aeromicrobium sp. Leaf350]|uniref:TadE/TadG family type IV pilus assembly protein n=1 Tax=Aeromicrobium sp. Leaf350 TaxID=2876565 RepID=UPI001E4F56CC|nr:TadE family protein [Aeromicrobium sp. Leaf350]
MSCRRRRERGAAAVEFALIAPLFIALLFGIISYGYMLSFRQGISQAAAEGARVYAVSPQGTDFKTNAISAINRSLSSYNVTCTAAGSLTRNGTVVGACTVPTTASTCTGSTSTTARCAKVEIRYNYRDHPLITSFPGLGFTLPETLRYDTTVQVN